MQVWKEIELGTLTSPDAVRAALDSRGIVRFGLADDIIGEMFERHTLLKFPIKHRRAPLVLTSVRELGFTERARNGLVRRRARESDVGLETCAMETAIQLALQGVERVGEHKCLHVVPHEEFVDSYKFHCALRLVWEDGCATPRLVGIAFADHDYLLLDTPLVFEQGW